MLHDGVGGHSVGRGEGSILGRACSMTKAFSDQQIYLLDDSVVPSWQYGRARDMPGATGEISDE